MSIVAFKKKSIIQYGSNRSGKPPGGFWQAQGPFSPNSIYGQPAFGPNGFSLQGSHRNVGYVGKDSKFSRNGTPFRGKHAYGSGGKGVYFHQPVFNVNRVIVLGDQYKYVKPSVLSTRGMLERKYKWAYNGQYPNYWVQPIYTGNQLKTASQEMYIHDKSAASDCKIDVNNEAQYVGHIVCQSQKCLNSAFKMKYNDIARLGPYTKNLHQPITSSQQTLRIQRKCANPTFAQKPFPYAVNTGTGILTGGTSVRSVGNACNQSPVFLAPPKWYVQEPNTGI